MKMKDGSYSLLPYLLAGFFGTLILAGLKAYDVIDISWWIVLLPWIGVSVIVIAIVLVLMFIFSFWRD